MRPQKIDDLQLLERLMTVIRTKGYQGASLNDFANAAGLKKASLYHRFPGGKKEIGAAVLQFVDLWYDANINKVILDKETHSKDKLKSVLNSIRKVYSNGESSCVLRALGLAEGIDLFGSELQHSTEKWINSFTQLGLEFGIKKKEAKEKAIEVLIQIQGSLVVSQNINDTMPFNLALKNIKYFYSDKDK